MTGDIGLLLDHAGGVGSILTGLGTLLTAAATAWNIWRTGKTQADVREGVAVSTRNENALIDVQKKQVENKADLTAKIQEVQHDLRNGGGTAIAQVVVKQLKPVLEETGKVITDQVAQNAATVAAVLAEKIAWDGVERRSGKDRRGSGA